VDDEQRAARSREVALDRIKRRSIKIGFEQMEQGKVMSTAQLKEGLREDISNHFKLKRSSCRDELSKQDGEAGVGIVHSVIGCDDVARLTRVATLPNNLAQLVLWARQHGLAGELMRPIGEVMPDEAGYELSLLEAVCGDAGQQARTPESRAAPARAGAARAWLMTQAAQVGACGARVELWRRNQAEGSLCILADLLLQLAGAPESMAVASLRFVPNRPVSVDVVSGVCRGTIVAASAVEVTLQFTGVQRLAVRAACDACRGERCVHRRALAARLLDACLDPDDRLHGLLRALAQAPPWMRFLATVAPPPALESAAMLRFELRLEGGRVLVQTMRRVGAASEPTRAKPWRLLRSTRLNVAQRTLLAAINRCAEVQGSEFVVADLAVLRALVDQPDVCETPGAVPIRLGEQRLKVALVRQRGGVRPEVSLGQQIVGVRDHDADHVVVRGPAEREWTFAALTPALGALLDGMEQFGDVLPPDSYASLAGWVASLSSAADVVVPDEVRGAEAPAVQKLRLRVDPRPVEGINVSLGVQCWLSPFWPPGSGDEVVHGWHAGAALVWRRDFAHERRLAAQVTADLLRRSGELDVDDPAQLSTAYSIPTDAGALEVLSAAARLTDVLDLEWTSVERQLRVKHLVTFSALHITLFKQGNWLHLNGSAEFDRTEIEFRRLIEAAKNGHRFIPIGGRDYAEIEQTLYERLREAQRACDFTEREIRILTAALPALRPQLGECVVAADASTADWLARVERATDAMPPLDSSVAAYLRPYQHQGVLWLLQRSAWASGVCLADEMGLGKTVQAIAVLAQRAATGPAMVVAPTSLVANWGAELERFAPQLRVLLYRGAKRRACLGQLGPGSVVVTSYEMLARDAAQLAAHEFATQVLDEAQAARNPGTRRNRALTRVTAGFRIALSGTPIENRLGDLWCLFDLLTPGLLGRWPRFRGLFGVPIERHEDVQRSTRLRALLGPFILRRTKAEVAQDLPARIEVVRTVELSVPERTLYRTALKRARLALRPKGKDRDGRKADRSIHVLAELTRLRQLACHPRLMLADARGESSKLHALLQLLEEILPLGHRALVFSQFATLLGFVAESLDARSIRWLLLDGRTPGPQRAGLVQRFQAGVADVFLISLKAGGTGLNLTAADYVIHLDPWWNPAVEDQASDRAHRIGQTRPVTIVKLVAQDTIEERVLGLHEHKRWLATTLLADGESTPEFDTAMLEALLAE
jgi:superfamily II DNA or RNA helicase